MSTHTDVLILGGGVIGLTAAYYLAREGLSVQVAEQGDFGRESSWAGAGIIPPADLDHARTPYERLRALSYEQFADFSEELRDLTGIDNGYSACGGLDFLHQGQPDEEWRGAGVPSEELGEAELREMEPGLGPSVRRALFLPGLAQVRSPRHLKALLAACDGRGVRLRPGCPVHGFERQGQRVTAARSAVGPLTADRYIVATGAWAGGLLESVGLATGIKPIRGQIALLRTPVPLVGRILVQGPRYLVPRTDGRVLVGSTEEDVGFDRRTTAGAIGELLRLACELVPALASAELERAWAGLRPGSPDGQPHLGPVPGCDNLFAASGHFRAGLSLSTGTARVLTDWFQGREATVPRDAFRPGRSAV